MCHIVRRIAARRRFRAESDGSQTLLTSHSGVPEIAQDYSAMQIRSRVGRIPAAPDEPLGCARLCAGLQPEANSDDNQSELTRCCVATLECLGVRRTDAKSDANPTELTRSCVATQRCDHGWTHWCDTKAGDKESAKVTQALWTGRVFPRGPWSTEEGL